MNGVCLLPLKETDRELKSEEPKDGRKLIERSGEE